MTSKLGRCIQGKIITFGPIWLKYLINMNVCAYLFYTHNYVTYEN